ncbi:hypothetical protein JXR93_00415 [bacterium]|nr:hypothetical protein [bacterium]
MINSLNGIWELKSKHLSDDLEGDVNGYIDFIDVSNLMVEWNLDFSFKMGAININLQFLVKYSANYYLNDNEIIQKIIYSKIVPLDSFTTNFITQFSDFLVSFQESFKIDTILKGKLTILSDSVMELKDSSSKKYLLVKKSTNNK